MSCTSASFYIKQENLDYINEQVSKKSRYNKSNWLDDLVDHLRSKNKGVVAEVIVPKKPVKRFIPPTVDEVKAYCNERMNFVDPAEFVDHYSSNGWMRGKAKIKDWKACVRTWEKNAKPNQGSAKQYSDVTAQNIKNLEGGW